MGHIGGIKNALRADIKNKVKVDVHVSPFSASASDNRPIDYCPYSRVTKLSSNWNCPGK